MLPIHETRNPTLELNVKNLTASLLSLKARVCRTAPTSHDWTRTPTVPTLDTHCLDSDSTRENLYLSGRNLRDACASPTQNGEMKRTPTVREKEPYGAYIRISTFLIRFSRATIPSIAPSDTSPAARPPRLIEV